MTIDKRLYYNKKVFDKFLSIVSGAQLPTDVLLQLLKALASFASKCHPGCFMSLPMERLLTETGARLIIENGVINGDQNHSLPNYHFSACLEEKKIFHVATTLYATGGHASFIANLVKLDGEHHHFLIVTGQGEVSSNKMIEAAFNSIEDIIYLSEETDLEKALILHNIVNHPDSSIFLHTHPNDIVPLLAFSQENNPPVVYINHSDHTFWLGASITDVLLNIRKEAEKISIERRGISENVVIPIPLHPIDSAFDHYYSKKKLGLSEDQVLIVSMGAAYKFKPEGNYDFFRTCDSIIEHNANVIIKIVGISPGDTSVSSKYIATGQLELLGVLEDVEQLKKAADIVIDPMPYGSYTSLLEFCAYGAFPMITYDSNPLFDLSMDPALSEIATMFESEDRYIEEISIIINNIEKRKSLRNIIRQRVEEWHSGQQWSNVYKNFTSKLNLMQHKLHQPSIKNALPEKIDLFLVRLGAGSCEREYKLMQNVIYQNISAFSLAEFIRMCPIIWILTENMNDMSRLKFFGALAKRSIFNIR